MTDQANEVGAVEITVKLSDDILRRIAERVPARPQRRLLTVPEAAEYIGRTVHGIRQMVRQHKIPVVRIDKKVMFDVQDLDKMIEANKVR